MKLYVTHNRKGPLGILRFANPAGNSLPSLLLKQINFRLIELEKDPKVKVIIIESEGERAFCGGASLSEMKTLVNLEQATNFFMGFAEVLNTIRTLTKFCVARVQGKVVGGGVGLVAACDYVVAHESAAIKLSELSIGIGPYVIEPAISRKIGLTAFINLSLDAYNWKSSKWGLEKGLYSSVYKNLEELDSGVNEIASRLAAYPQKAIKTLRKLHWKDTDFWADLLPKNAKITGKLALEQATQNILKKL